MSNLIHRQSVIQEKRKKTPRRKFIMESAGWFNIVIQKTTQGVGRYPKEGRFKNILMKSEYEKSNLLELEIDQNIPFINQLDYLFTHCPKLENLNVDENENSMYTESSFGAKNAYLCIEVGLGVENVLYSMMVYYNCTNVINSLQVTNGCNNIYTSKVVTQSSNIF